jgi:FdhD protein
MTTVRPAHILKYQEGAMQRLDDLVAVEEPLEIRLGYGPAHVREQKSLAVTMRTPGHDLELALGFLFTEGIIHRMDEVGNIRHCEQVKKEEEKGNVVRVELGPSVRVDWAKLQRNFYTSSSCGVCGKSSIESVAVECRPLEDSGWSVSVKTLLSLSESLREQQAVFAHTGGLHASGLFDAQGTLIMLREDVGRHNALDKVIGAAMGNGWLPLSQYMLLVSGRASFELVQKAAKAGISVLVAVGAPSSLAVSLAESLGITLIGFLRDKRFNVYTHPQRVME